MSWAVIAVLVCYIVIGQKVTLDAYRHLRDPRRTYYYPPLLSPEEFSPEGEAARRRAVRYWYGGAVLMAVLVLAVWFAQRQ